MHFDFIETKGFEEGEIFLNFRIEFLYIIVGVIDKYVSDRFSHNVVAIN